MSHKLCNVLKRMNVYMNLFCATFSFRCIVDFVFEIHSELVWDLAFCESDSDANRDFCDPDTDANQVSGPGWRPYRLGSPIQQHASSWGASPLRSVRGQAPHQFFLVVYVIRIGPFFDGF